MSPRPFYPRNSRMTTVLTLGILSFILLGPFTGIPAVIIGQQELGHIKTGITDPDDKALIQTGIVLAIVGSITTTWWILTELLELL